jgi:hypothetical protein
LARLVLPSHPPPDKPGIWADVKGPSAGEFDVQDRNTWKEGPTTSENSKRAGMNQEEVAHQFEELADLFLYLVFFFCAVELYKLLLLNEFHVSYFDYGAWFFEEQLLTIPTSRK